MERATDQLASAEYDLIVVGGGAFGACATWEATLRGLSVLLLERGDFGGATTANSYKIAHGGIRYLQHGDVRRVRRSAGERSALLRVAPHLVHPVPIAIPTYGRGLQGKAALRAAFAAYDLLTWDRNRGIPDPSRHVPAGSFLSRSAALERFPGLPAEGLTGAGVFHDGQMYSPPRLTLAFVRAAAENGATVANYAEVRDLLRRGDSVVGVRVRDRLAGRELEVAGRMVLNAAGPWATPLLEEGAGIRLGPERPTFSRDVGLVVRRPWEASTGLACPTRTRDADSVIDRGGRHLFFLPWRGHTMIGVWHGVYRGSPDEIRVTPEELRGFVAEANEAYPGLDLSADEVSMVNTGLILFGDADQEEEAHSFGHHSILTDHAEEHGVEGLLTLIGVRSTMARAMAEEALDLVLEKLGRQAVVSTSASRPVYGGEVPSFADLVADLERRLPEGAPAAAATALAHNHGSRADDVLDYVRREPELGRPLPGSSVLGAEVVHATEREMAVRLADVVLRRTDLGTAEAPEPECLEACADLVAPRLGWDEERRRREVAELRSFFEERGATRSFGRPSRAA